MRSALANEILPPMLNDLNNFLEGSQFSYGNSLTIADLEVYNIVGWLSRGILDGIPHDICDKYPNIVGVASTVKNHAAVKAFEASNPC